MKRWQIFFISMLFALGAAVSAPALARGGGGHGHSGGHGHGGWHGHTSVGVFVGPAWYAPYYPYYYPPYYPYYYPPVSAPPTYIEQAPAMAPGFWYYCGGSQAYYPNVRECPGGWQQVAPQPGR